MYIVDIHILKESVVATAAHFILHKKGMIIWNTGYFLSGP